MTQHTAKVNFTRGEITPLAHARRDIALYTAAAKTLYNWYVLKEGGVRRRSGTKFIGAIKNARTDTRLVDFVFSSSQAYVLEMGDLYTRFWTNGAQVASGLSPYEVASPFAAANLRSIQWAQSFDTMFFACPSYTITPKKLQRFGNANWQWHDIAFVDGPYYPINDQNNVVTPGGVPYVGTTVVMSHANVTNINGGVGFLATDVGRHYRIELSGTWAWGVITSVPNSTTAYVLIKGSGFTQNASSGTWVRYGAYTSSSVEPGAGLEITLQTGSSTLSSSDVGKVGLFAIGSTTYFAVITGVETSATVKVVLANGTFAASTSLSWQLGAFSQTTGYPSVISWFQGRLFLGGTASMPNASWYSQSGLPENFAPSDYDGTVADNHGGMIQTLGRADTILWLAEAPRLQVGTTGAIRSIGASDTTQAFTPRNISQRLEVAGGVAPVIPINVGPSTVHVDRFGNRIHDLYFDFSVNGLVAPDLSVVAEHLFDPTVKELWFQQKPNDMFWSVLNDGTLVTTTMERYEKVIGFSRHELVGAQVISACVIPGTTQDDVYMVVQRTIGTVPVQYMELLQPRFLRNAKADAWFLDCGGQYVGAPTNQVTGAAWLEATTVDVLADGVVIKGLPITGGTFTLPNNRTASKITFGYSIPNAGGTLPPPIDTPEGSTYCKRMRVVNCIVDMYETLGLKFTSDSGAIDLLTYRKPNMPMNTTPPLITGHRKLGIDGSWSSDGEIMWSIDDPLPGTIRALNIGLDPEP